MVEGETTPEEPAAAPAAPKRRTRSAPRAQASRKPAEAAAPRARKTPARPRAAKARTRKDTPSE